MVKELIFICQKKYMKTQLVLTILNFHVLPHLWIPEFSGTLFAQFLSHVCGCERSFVFASACFALRLRWF